MRTETPLYETRCKGCGRLLVTVEQLRDPETLLLEAHLRACGASEPLPPAPVMLGELMSRVSVNIRAKVSS